MRSNDFESLHNAATNAASANIRVFILDTREKKLSEGQERPLQDILERTSTDNKGSGGKEASRVGIMHGGSILVQDGSGIGYTEQRGNVLREHLVWRPSVAIKLIDKIVADVAAGNKPAVKTKSTKADKPKVTRSTKSVEQPKRRIVRRVA